MTNLDAEFGNLESHVMVIDNRRSCLATVTRGKREKCSAIRDV